MQHNNPSDVAPERKLAHLEMAAHSQTGPDLMDRRFFYEPLLAAHPSPQLHELTTNFLGKKLKAPLWISSMTGGATSAGPINKMLAQVACQFGLGMGLGSCRQLLTSDEYFNDFNLRPILGSDLPLMANLGLAQIEQISNSDKKFVSIHQLVKRLDADGLIIHVNPMQEFFQSEGDRYSRPAIDTISDFLNNAAYPVIVKEVGQGIGPAGLRALARLPLAAIDCAAFGGTNFAKLEQLRSQNMNQDLSVAMVGHGLDEMVEWLINIKKELGSDMLVKTIIVSGGVRSALDGHFYTELLNRQQIHSLYAMGNPFLQAAQAGRQQLEDFIANHLQTLALARAFLKVRF
jgi:isopentenyl-diphosphate delta-isomerase